MMNSENQSNYSQYSGNNNYVKPDNNYYRNQPNYPSHPNPYPQMPQSPYPGGAPYPMPYANVPEEISMWKYLGMMWISVIPFVGFIMLLIWAFSGEQINRRNYARAILVNMIITAVIAFLTWSFFFALFLGLAERM